VAMMLQTIEIAALSMNWALLIVSTLWPRHSTRCAKSCRASTTDLVGPMCPRSTPGGSNARCGEADSGGGNDMRCGEMEREEG
jgi:hypothetical protein